MALTLTGLIPTIQSANQKVSRELIGFIPSVTVNARAQAAAVGQTITSAVSPARTASTITAAATPPATGSTTYGTNSFSIADSKSVLIDWSGEEELGVDVQGRPVNLILERDFAQAFRTLANEIESDIGALYVAASRATGTSGTTPFGSTLTEAAAGHKIIDDNGAPPSLRFMLGNTTTTAALRLRATLNDPNQAVQDFVQQGAMINLFGAGYKQSAGVASHTKGTGTSYQTNNASGYAIGDTTIALDTGSGTVLAGDVVTFTGDTNQYVVKTALSGGNIVLQEPGLRATLADNVAMTITNSYTANLIFSQDALELAVRLPKSPTLGDGAADVMTMQDPVSRLMFEIRLYKLYRMIRYEVGIAWGVNAPNPRHLAIIKG